MEVSWALLANAVIAGLLLGGFYAAMSVGISISFGMLDVVNIAHPAFIILGSYIAYIVNDRFGFDPIVVSVAASPLFFLLGMVLYRIYYICFARRGQESVRGVPQPGVCRVRAVVRGLDPRHAARRLRARPRRVLLLHLFRAFVGAGVFIRPLARHAGVSSLGPPGPMSNKVFAAVALAVALALAAVTQLIPNDYFFTAAYTVLLFVILATAWNILGGYTGYVNFGSAAFFAIGAYTTVFLYNAFKAPLPVGIVAGTLVAGLAGLGLGYLTLRLRGVFFAIASLALAVVLYIFIVNWDYVGGARGAYVLQPREVPFGLPRYIHLIYAVQLVMAAFALAVARAIEHSTLGRGLAAIRDDELAAECSGVPTLKLKIFSTMVSCALMGMAGTTFPYYLSYIEPSSAFSLSYAVNSIAMPLIGGMMSWMGPLIGAVLLGSVQQLVQVTVSSAWNLLIVGVLLVLFVTLAPNGIMGWVDAWRRRKGR